MKVGTNGIQDPREHTLMGYFFYNSIKAVEYGVESQSLDTDFLGSNPVFQTSWVQILCLPLGFLFVILSKCFIFSSLKLR